MFAPLRRRLPPASATTGAHTGGAAGTAGPGAASAARGVAEGSGSRAAGSCRYAAVPDTIAPSTTSPASIANAPLLTAAPVGITPVGITPVGINPVGITPIRAYALLPAAILTRAVHVSSLLPVTELTLVLPRICLAGGHRIATRRPDEFVRRRFVGVGCASAVLRIVLPGVPGAIACIYVLSVR